MMAELPALQVEYTHVLCARHGEPFRDQWPSGYLVFSVKALHPILNDAELARALRFGEDGWEQRLLAELAETPLCCRLERAELHRLYLGAREWPWGVCVVCGLAKKGAPYSYMNAMRQVERKSHVCFDCVLDRMQPNG